MTVPDTWLEHIRTWAASEPYVARVWLFGSRVTGVRRPKNAALGESDLDIAYQLAGAPPGELLAHAIFSKAKWAAALSALLPVKVDLQQAEEGDVVVMPAVRDHGRLIYERPI